MSELVYRRVDLRYRLGTPTGHSETTMPTTWTFTLPAEQDSGEAWSELLQRIVYDANVNLRRQEPGDPNWLVLDYYTVEPIDVATFASWDGSVESAESTAPWLLDRTAVWAPAPCFAVDEQGRYEGLSAVELSRRMLDAARESGALTEGQITALSTQLERLPSQAPIAAPRFRRRPGEEPFRSGPPLAHHLDPSQPPPSSSPPSTVLLPAESQLPPVRSKLVAYSRGEIDVDGIVEVLLAHDGYLVPVSLFDEPLVRPTVELSASQAFPAGELWVFTDEAAARRVLPQWETMGTFYSQVSAPTWIARLRSRRFTKLKFNPGGPRAEFFFADSGAFHILEEAARRHAPAKPEKGEPTSEATTEDATTTIVELARGGKLIQAIKLYRKRHDCDLRTARAAVNELVDASRAADDGPAQGPGAEVASLIHVRSIKEEHTYLDLNPCGCGSTRRPARGTLLKNNGKWIQRVAWSCEQCGARRQFDFVFPDDDAYLSLEGYGPPGQPSTAIDAMQFMRLSDAWARSAPASPSNAEMAARTERALKEASWAMEEVLKFIGPGERDKPPLSAFWADGSREEAQPILNQFERARLEVRLKTYRKLLDNIQEEEPDAPAAGAASAPQNTAPAPGDAPRPGRIERVAFEPTTADDAAQALRFVAAGKEAAEMMDDLSLFFGGARANLRVQAVYDPGSEDTRAALHFVALGAAVCAQAGEVSPMAWVDGFHAALVIGEVGKVEELSVVPRTEIQPVESPQDRLLLHYIQVASAFARGEHARCRELATDCLQAASAASGDEATFAQSIASLTQLMTSLYDDPLAESFPDRLFEAVGAHHAHLETLSRADRSAGALALGPLAMACLALARRVEPGFASDYIPEALLALHRRPPQEATPAPGLLPTLQAFGQEIDRDIAAGNRGRAEAIGQLAATVFGSAATIEEERLGSLLAFGMKFLSWELYGPGVDFMTALARHAEANSSPLQQSINAYMFGYALLAGRINDVSQRIGVLGVLHDDLGPMHPLFARVSAYVQHGGAPPSRPDNLPSLDAAQAPQPPTGEELKEAIAWWMTLAFIAIAGADDHISPDEVAAFHDILDGAQIEDMLARHGAEEVGRRLGAGELQRISMRLAQAEPALRRGMADVLLRLIAADGEVLPEEMAMGRKIAGWLHVSLLGTSPG